MNIDELIKQKNAQLDAKADATFNKVEASKYTWVYVLAAALLVAALIVWGIG